MKKGGPPNKKPRYNHIYPTIVYLFIIAFEENLMACVNKWNCIFFFDRFNDEDDPSQFEDELALLDEIEMEMQDNFDEHDGTAGDYAWRFPLLH